MAIDFRIPPTHPRNLKNMVFDSGAYAISHICDQLLIYDQILIRCDFSTMTSIYGGLECKDLEPLLKNERIKYFAPKSGCRYGVPCLKSNTTRVNSLFLNEF